MSRWICFGLLLVGCGDASEDVGEPVDLVESLAAKGPYEVGYQSTELTWTDPDEGPRTLRLATWYPSHEASGDPPLYQGLYEGEGAWLDATPALGPFPAVVFSHGHLAFAEGASFLAVHLASHGSVVVAPDHTGNLTWDGDNRETWIYALRPLDLTAVIDHLEALPPSDALAGRVHTDRLVAWGHSFGGYTVFAAAGADHDLEGIDAGCVADPEDPICSDWDSWRDRFAGGFADERISAGLVMAAGDHGRFGDAGVSAVSTPILTLTSGLDSGADNDAYWESLTGGSHRRVHFEHGGHNSYTDFAGILDPEPGLLDPEEGKRAISVYSLAFVKQAQGQAGMAPILDGEEPVHDDATVMTK